MTDEPEHLTGPPPRGGTLAGYRYRVPEIARACYDAGWHEYHHLVDAVAIVLAESGGYSEAENTNDDGSVDRGPWQINSIHVDAGDISADDCYDLIASSTFARQLYTRWSYTFNPWVAYKTGAHHRHYQDATRGVANYLRQDWDIPGLVEKEG